MKVELNIQELVLHGFAAHERYAIAEAVQEELARILQQTDLTQKIVQDRDISRLDGGEFRMEAAGKPRAIGAQIARQVNDALRGLAHREEAGRPSGGKG